MEVMVDLVDALIAFPFFFQISPILCYTTYSKKFRWFGVDIMLCLDGNGTLEMFRLWPIGEVALMEDWDLLRG